MKWIMLINLLGASWERPDLIQRIPGWSSQQTCQQAGSEFEARYKLAYQQLQIRCEPDRDSITVILPEPR